MRTVLLALAALALASTAQAQSFVTGNITAAAGSVSLNTQTVSPVPSTCSVSVSGTFSATLEFDGSVLGSSTWRPISLRGASSGTTVTTTTAAGDFVGSCAGFEKMRVVATSYSSGTAIVTIAGAPGTGSVFSALEANTTNAQSAVAVRVVEDGYPAG